MDFIDKLTGRADERKRREEAECRTRDELRRTAAERAAKEHAQGQADLIKREKDMEKIEKEQAQQRAAKIEREKETERREKEKAQERAALVKKEKDAERREKEKALERAEQERQKREQLQRESQAILEENKRRQQALEKEKRQLLEHAEKLAEKTDILQRNKEEIEREKEELLLQNEERKNLEDKQREFNWGPKKNPKWTEGEVERLQKYVTEKRKDRDGNHLCLRFLIFGPTGHGKSSFCNGCRSAIKGTDNPSTYHQVAEGGHGSLTRGFHGASYGDHWIIDMAGIFESDRITSMNIEDIASGKIPFYAQITDTLQKENGENDIPAAGENDVSCVVIVLRYDTELGPELKRQLGVILSLGGRGVISCHLVLTCLDECDPQFNHTENIPNLYDSPKVQAAVQRMSGETGIPPYAISFVRNYTKEIETDLNTTLLHLRVLQRTIISSLDQVEKKLDMMRHKELYSKSKKTRQIKDVEPEERKVRDDKEETPVDKQPGKGETVGITLTVKDLMLMFVIVLLAVLLMVYKS